MIKVLLTFVVHYYECNMKSTYNTGDCEYQQTGAHTEDKTAWSVTQVHTVFVSQKLKNHTVNSQGTCAQENSTH